MSPREKQDQLQAPNPFNTATQWHNSSAMRVFKCLRQREGDEHTNLVKPNKLFYIVRLPKATAIIVKSILSVHLMVKRSTKCHQ